MDIVEFYHELEIDSTNVLQRLNNSEVLLGKFLKAFYKDQTFNELSQAVLDEDYEQIEKTAHKLKGISSNFDFVAIYDFSSKIVMACRSNEFNKVATNFEKLKVTYDITIKLLEKYIID